MFVLQTLESLLSQGSIDVGFFYEVEKQWAGDLRFISLPDHIDMSDDSLNWYYAKVWMHLFSVLLGLALVVSKQGKQIY